MKVPPNVVHPALGGKIIKDAVKIGRQHSLRKLHAVGETLTILCAIISANEYKIRFSFGEGNILLRCCTDRGQEDLAVGLFVGLGFGKYYAAIGDLEGAPTARLPKASVVSVVSKVLFKANDRGRWRLKRRMNTGSVGCE